MGLDFLEQISSELDLMGKEIERLLFKEPQAVLSKTRIVAEELALLLNQQEGIKEVYEIKQVDRVHKLERKGVIEAEQKSKFDWLRREGNKAAHQPNYGSVELAINAHRNLYDLAGWYVECYGETDFTLPPYELPRIQDSGGVATTDIERVMAQLMDEKMAPLLNQFMEKLEQAQSTETTAQKEMAATIEADPSAEQTATSAVKKEPSTSKSSQTKVMLAEYLTKHLGYTIIDKRENQGALWVVGGWDLSEQLLALKENKIYFRYASKGSKATKEEPAWFLVNKRSASKLFVMVEGVEDTLEDQEKPAVQPDQESGLELKDYLTAKGLEVIDKRTTGGTLWVIGGWELEPEFKPLKEQKIYFRFTKKGSKATGNQAAWFLLNKKKDNLYVEGAEELSTLTTSEDSKQEERRPEDFEALEKTTKEDSEQHFKEVESKPLQENPLITPESGNVEVLKEPTLEETHQMMFKIIRPLSSYQVGEWTLPLPEEVMNNVISDNKVGRELLAKAGQRTITSLKISDMRELYQKNQPLFYELIQFMAVMGIRFEGALNNFVPFEINTESGFLQVTNQDILLKDLLSSVHRERLVSYGIDMTTQLNGLSISSLEYLFKDLDEKPLHFLEQTVETKKEEKEPFFFQLLDDQYTLPGDILDLPLSTELFSRSTRLMLCLNSDGYQYIKDLPIDLSPFIGKYKGVGVGVMKKFIHQLKVIKIQAYEHTKEEIIPNQNLHYQSEIIELDDSSRSFLLSDMTFQSVNILILRFNEAGFLTIGDLPPRLEKLTELKSIGHTAIRKFFDQLSSEIERLEKKRDYETLSLSNQVELVINNLRESLQEQNKIVKERPREILLERFTRMQRNEPATLETLGQEFGVTRERIRQIIKKTLSTIANEGSELVHLLTKKLGDSPYLENVWFNSGHFIDHLILEALEKQANIFIEEESNLLTNMPEVVREEEKKGVLLKLKETFTGVESSLAQVYKWFAENTPWPLGKMDAVFAEHFKQTATPAKGYVLVSSTKLELAELVMRQYPEGVEVYKRAEELNEKGNQLVEGLFASERDFSALCNRDEAVDRLLLWGRGIYIHRDYVDIPTELLRIIEQDILQRFESQSELQIRIIFDKFEEQLVAHKVPTEYALYTLLRLFGSGVFYLPKYPLITKEEQDFQYNADRIKRFMREHGGRASSQILREEFVKKQGWKDYTLQLTLSSGPFVQEQRGVYVLFSFYDDIQYATLKPIYDAIRGALITKEFVLIHKMYLNHQVMCKQIGIQSPQLLYVLLADRNQDESIQFKRHPYVLSAEANIERLSKVSLVEGYAREEEREIPREELIDFIDEIGGVSDYVDQVLVKSENLFYYTRGKFGEYIHRDIIEWTEDKEKSLRTNVTHYLTSSDLPFVQVEELYYGVEKPELANEMTWTEDLFSDLLLRIDGFIEIGSMRKLIAHKENLCSDVDFLTYLITDNYGGTVKKSVLEKHLRQLGFNKNGVLSFEANQALEMGQTPFILQGDEFVLRDWVEE
ncbi:sigma factor-like helix-turn-helix DNA-binding protein [Alkalicoccobacillus porphyridii]|uniref:RNA polymerase sigma-70 region 4 domain-containing protein n=1 Tax=Alkalicoccobacillus porphyridii TaxID=2597270 RepID=A0A554A1Z1_9BACI|nr:sigma factor-like helix-turn-helix DNA-binding protein [Alkalicoccobacillus porphyridii]TSB47699.1 hypothetical protein FN960_04055 [Alkalicoccobacillus porphyridii]